MADLPNIFEVEDIHDPRLDDYRDIRDRELLGRHGFPGLFVAEQALVVERMLGLPGVAKSVLVAPHCADRIGALTPDDVPVYVAPLRVMRQVAGFNIHRGVLGIGRRSAIERTNLEAAVPRRDSLTVLACEDVTNIDNIGFLFRNAAAFGVDAVILSPRCHDPLYRKSLRVSIGHALTVPFVHSRDWQADLQRLKSDWDITLIGTAASPAVDVDSVPRPPRVGLIVGQEYAGLSAATLCQCDRIVRIPMAAGVDSLNVAVAAAVCLHRFSNAKRV